MKLVTDDYITVNPAVSRSTHARPLFCVMWFKYDKPHDEYLLHKCSRPLNERAARTLAESWAAAEGLEIR